MTETRNVPYLDRIPICPHCGQHPADHSSEQCVNELVKQRDAALEAYGALLTGVILYMERELQRNERP